MMKDALTAFERDQLVAMPTETVYGLAAPVDRSDLIEQIFLLKKRPSFDPLIVHVSSVEMAKNYVQKWPEVAELLTKHFWPGPLTLVLSKSDKVSDAISAGLPTVAVRCPRHTLALEFIDKVGVGVAAPSANIFTKTSPTSSQHVRKYFSQEDVYVLEGGECEVGLESTIVEISDEGLFMLRPGSLTAGMIKDKTGLDVLKKKSLLEVQAPGAHHTHYRPAYPLVVTKKMLSDKEIKELEIKFSGPGQTILYEESPEVIARTLYAELHRSLPEKKGYKSLDFSKVYSNYPEERWEAIFNRLSKACTLSID